MTSLDICYGTLIFVLGLLFGSFGNALAYRIPREISILNPRRSFCPQCNSQIAWYDNIPLFSYLILRGHCRKCGKYFSIEYFLVELICGFLFLALYLKLGLSITLVELLLFAWAGLVASVIDIHFRILPDVFTLSGIVIGLVGSLINPERSFIDALIGVLGGGGFLWLVAYVYLLLRNEEGMGGGDIKLIAWIGAVMGWQAAIFAILASSIVGSVFGISMAVIKRSGLKTSMPFGPFLFAGALMYIFIGGPIIKWYLSVFFPFVE